MDVNLPPRESRCQTGVLPFLADGQRQLVVRHGHPGHLRVAVQDVHLDHLGRRQRVAHVGGRVLGVVDDVDLLPAQLLHDVGHTRAARADAGTLCVDALDGGAHRDLGAVAGLASDRDDLHGTVLNLGHLEREQAAHQLRVRARQVDLHIALTLVHAHHIRLDAIAVGEALARDLLSGQEDAVLRIRLGAQLDDGQAARLRVGVALHHAGDDVALEL